MPYVILFLVSAIIDVIGLGLVAPIISLIVNPESELTRNMDDFSSKIAGEYDYNFSLSYLFCF